MGSSSIAGLTLALNCPRPFGAFTFRQPSCSAVFSNFLFGFASHTTRKQDRLSEVLKPGVGRWEEGKGRETLVMVLFGCWCSLGTDRKDSSEDNGKRRALIDGRRNDHPNNLRKKFKTRPSPLCLSCDFFCPLPIKLEHLLLLSTSYRKLHLQPLDTALRTNEAWTEPRQRKNRYRGTARAIVENRHKQHKKNDEILAGRSTERG